jgi:hypothetical protein
MIQKQMMIDSQMVEKQKPSNHSGFEKERSHIHRSVNLFKLVARIEQGMWSSAQMANRHDIHKKRIKSGVKIKFDSGLMYEIGRPQQIKMGSDMRVMTSCSSKKLVR